MEIYVDVWGQLALSKLFSSRLAKGLVEATLLELGGGIEIPTFPLNTDGIDIWGQNMTFRNIKITNFDDAIVPKPSNKGATIATCTQDILVEDCDVVFSVGMTIGSVPPNNHACIQNVIFRNINMDKPLKGIYVKSNPGDNGDGIIRNITYENFVMKHPVWWAIYIGPQQQKQPGGGGPGCMIYPINRDCPTNPRITMQDITLRNITSTGGLLPAGILRCNSTNPCTGFVFEDVNVKSAFWDLLGYGYITEFVEGTSTNNFPDPNFKAPGFYDNLANRELHQPSYMDHLQASGMELMWKFMFGGQKDKLGFYKVFEEHVEFMEDMTAALFPVDKIEELL